MNKNEQSNLCEGLVAKLSRGKRNVFGIITFGDDIPDFLVCGHRMKILRLWIKHRDAVWTEQTFKGNLIMRCNRATIPGEFYLGDENWEHRTSSLDPYPDVICIALVASPADNQVVVGFKGIFNASCSSACMIQDEAFADTLLWEGKQLENAATMPIRGDHYAEQTN